VLTAKLVRSNRKKGTDTITELSANGNDYKGEENVVKAFQDHFRKLATFSLQATSDVFPLSLQILYFYLEFEIAVLISLVHTFSFGFALKIALFEVDKEWYEVILRENISSIKHKLVTGDIPIGENILKICEIMKSAAITSSSNKAIFKAKPKLKVGDRRCFLEDFAGLFSLSILLL
jgi:hypothetical protein